jgi:uncharacterized membrane protein required for colicin V production
MMLPGMGDIAVAVAGAVGGVLRYLIKPTRPLWEALVSTVIGVALAIYLTPVLAPVAAALMTKYIPEAQYEPASLVIATGAVIGFVGRDVLEVLLDIIRQRRLRP